MILWALYQCGEYYFEAEDYINALKCFNRNLKEDPNNGLYYKARGKTYLKTATYRYAISDLSMSLDLRPDDAETWMYHGNMPRYNRVIRKMAVLALQSPEVWEVRRH